MTTYTFLVRVEAETLNEAEFELRARALNFEEVFITKQGRVLRDADIEKLAEEAERGYDTSQILRRQSR